jgi:hypothetical protein
VTEECDDASEEGKCIDIIIIPVTTDDEFKLDTVSTPKVSPIGLGTIELCMTDGYPKTGMCDDTFSVSIKPITLDTTQLTVSMDARALNVIDSECDDTTGCITVKYGGAYSGEYEWIINSELNGNIDTSDHVLDVVIEIADI